MSKKDEPYHWKKPVGRPDFSYQIHGGTVAPTGYLKVLVGRNLKHVLTYNRTTLTQVQRTAKQLADSLNGHVVSGAEFCK
jgi:hypothetical protein